MKSILLLEKEKRDSYNNYILKLLKEKYTLVDPTTTVCSKSAFASNVYKYLADRLNISVSPCFIVKIKSILNIIPARYCGNVYLKGIVACEEDILITNEDRIKQNIYCNAYKKREKAKKLLSQSTIP